MTDSRQHSLKTNHYLVSRGGGEVDHGGSHGSQGDRRGELVVTDRVSKETEGNRQPS